MTALRPAAAPSPAMLDPGLPQLERALDQGAMTWLLRRYAAPALGSTRLVVERIRLVRHKPGRRALVEYRVRLDQERPAALLGKVRARGADGRTFHLHQRLEAAGYRQGAAVFVPGAVALVPEAGLWLQHRVHGASLGPRLGTRAGPAAAAQVAGALARLQQMEVRPDRVHGAADELQVLQRELTLLGDARPELRSRLGRLLAVAETLTEPLDTLRVPVHRDFYQDQLLLLGEATCLLDLDLCSLGHPALDAGNFTAHLIELGLRRHNDPQAFRAERRAFEAAWLARQGPHHREALTGCTTLTLARHVGLAWRLPGRAHLVGRLLDLTEARCGGRASCDPCW